ncbi:MAG TPA: hypothetical protein VFB68_09900 [Xanthobacteraceae bacterium]|nr:hypothetical protein [Xanthobacteraceae bacterium]
MEQVGYVILAVGLVVAFLYVSNRTWRKGNYWGMNFDRAVCSRCGTPKPMFQFRIPPFKERLLGGWTCKTCGAKLNRRGEERSW